ncbi:MAG: Flp family type IVb pilin [Planctomycetota bacterium]|nr:Flp family type IVb pilin [Planctomycetota bacterium]
MFAAAVDRVRTFLKREGGATLVEYSVMLGLIVLLSITAIQVIGSVAADSFGKTDKIFSKSSGS